MSIGMGLAIMLISFAILEGFRDEIRDKIVSFGGHMQLSKFDTVYNEVVQVKGNQHKVVSLIREYNIKVKSTLVRQ